MRPSGTRIVSEIEKPSTLALSCEAGNRTRGPEQMRPRSGLVVTRILQGLGDCVEYSDADVGDTAEGEAPREDE